MSRRLTWVHVFLAVFSATAYSSPPARVPTAAINNARNPTEFILRHVNKKPGMGVNSAEEAILFSQSGSVNAGGASQIADMLAEGDACEPKPSTYVIPRNASDSRSFYYPTCTKVNRCGGCCGSDLEECAPTQVVTRNIKVMKCRYPDDESSDTFEFEGLVNIPIEVHTACECRCRVQQFNCDPVKHTYSADTCECLCRNRQMATQCPSNKHWDERECSCVCLRIANCLSDEFFNFNTCSCQRGSTSPSGELAPVNPCATSTTRCRPGWTLRPLPDGSCGCRV